MSYWDHDYEYYAPRKPRAVKDGIKLQSKKLGSTWWSKKWISALESFSASNRLERGRRYARGGQVINFKINERGDVSAKVQGSASRPYSVTIKIETFSDKEWERILTEMSSQALLIAKLLNGEMPADIDEAFSKIGASLFPKSRAEIKTDCSCPDYENPCKHIAAVHYILGEEFDRNPFMIFKLRGRTEEQVISELRRLRSFDTETHEEVSSSDEEKYDVVSLNECTSNFWFFGDDFKKIFVSITSPTVTLAILKRLGTPPFWQDDDFWTDMGRIYTFISDSAIKEAYSVSEYDKEIQSDEKDIDLCNIILHGTWIPGSETPEKKDNKGKFLFWGEKIKISDSGKDKRGKKKNLMEGGINKKGRINKIPEHPFCTSSDEIIEIIKTLEFNLSSNEADSSLIIALPESEGTPYPSFKIPERAETKESKSKTKTLSNWRIPALELSARQALLGLARLPLNGILHSNNKIRFGNDILFWSMLAKFGFELMARQRFVPSITGSGKEGLHAMWHPVYNYGEDARRIDLFVDSMPSVCGAAIGIENKNLVEFSPAKLIIDFLNTSIDETCRLWFGNKISETLLWENKISRDTLPSKWLSALGSSDGRVKGTTHECNVLKSDVDKWALAIKTEGVETPFRTCFRLEEPEDEHTDVYGNKTEKRDQWRISFHLQGMDDQSLLVPAEKIWRSKSLKYLNRKFEHPQEMFLGDLAKAARLFPPIEQSLKTRRPERCNIGTDWAYNFLKEGAWLLEESGYGILIPSWWSKKGAAADIRIRAKLKSPKIDTSTRQSFFGLENIIDFNWEVAIGDEILTREELERLSKLKLPLIKVRGKWIEFKKERIGDALEVVDRYKSEGMTLAQALRINSGMAEIGVPMEFDSSGWLKNMIIGDDIGNFSKSNTPESFNGVLRPYQITGFSWLSFLKSMGIGACLADDMGLGKTIQVISLLLHDKDMTKKVGKERNKEIKTKTPVLLVAPTSVIGNWHHELARFSPSLKAMIHHGQSRSGGRKFADSAKEHDIVVTTYALSVRDQKDLANIRWAGVILDEAQCIKNPYTKQAQSIRKISKQSGYRIALTGTPIENRLSELWSIMEFLNPGYLGSFKEFREKFAIPIERYKNPEVSEKLKNLVKPLVLRRVKTDKKVINDLPDKIEMKTYCTLTVEQTTLYKAVVDEMMQEIEQSEGIQRKGLVLSALTKLKQICNHPALFLHDGSSLNKRSGKLEQLKDMLDVVLAANERALVFTQYSEMGEMLKDHIKEAYGREVFFLHGGVPQKERDRMVTLFQEDKNAPPIFILSVKAGGLGLNLTSANHVFHFDRWWNPAVENQATDRSFRIGQQKNVQVHKFITEGTVEEKIDDMIEVKKDLLDRILSVGESMLTELSNEKLREIFSLREDY